MPNYATIAGTGHASPIKIAIGMPRCFRRHTR